MKTWTIPVCLVLASCHGNTRKQVAEESSYAPLDVGANYNQLQRVTAEPFLSAVHGNRWVHVYVTPSAVETYVGDGEIPVGTVIVKTSVEGENGQPGTFPGPVFVMEKRAKGYDPEHDDWYYAIHWENPTPQQREKLGGPIYWRGKSPRVQYCYDCHDAYDRSLGGLTPSSQLIR